jgi:AcrR family transcriptional regulator
VELSPGAVYRYFRSKEDIIAAQAERGQAQNAEAIEAAMQQPETLGVFNELIRTFFIEMENLKSAEFCALNVELISEAPRNERIRDALTRTGRQVREVLIGLVQDAQARGEIAAELDPEAVARSMVALYQGFVTQKLVEPDIDVAAYAEVLRALFGGRFWQGSDAPVAVSSERPAAALRH